MENRSPNYFAAIRSQERFLLRDAKCICSIFTVICRYVYGPLSVQVTSWTWQKQVGIPQPHHPNSAWRLVLKSYFFSEVPSPEKVKKWLFIEHILTFSSHWILSSVGLDRNSSEWSQGPELKLLDVSSYLTGLDIPFLKCMMCVLDFKNTSLRYTALSILVIDAILIFLNQLFREWPHGFSEHSNHCLFLKVFKNWITLRQCIIVENTHEIKIIDYQGP